MHHRNTSSSPGGSSAPDSDSASGIFAAWLSWIISSGALLVVMAAPLVLRPLWVPLLAVALEITLSAMVRYGRDRGCERCYLSIFIASRTMLWSAVAMIATLLLQRSAASPVELTGQPVNPAIPFIPVLIVAPVAAVMGLWASRSGGSFPFCADCRLRLGAIAERGFLGSLLSQEGSAQAKVMGVGCAILSVVVWAYYLLRYVNVSLNSADLYFFFYLPAALWVIAAIYMSLRYTGIHRYYDQDLEGSRQRHGSSSRLRFIIVSGNRLLVSAPHPDEADSIVDLGRTRADTPAQVILPYRLNIPLHEARQYLEGILPVDRDTPMKFLYSSAEWLNRCNAFLFIVNVDEPTAERLTRAVAHPRWITLHDYNSLLAQGAVEPLLAAEIHRIYTMAMAAKTYLPDGRRRYPIRHYRPTFRFCDVIDYKVDFADLRWLAIARCNQDTPLWRIRRLLRRYPFPGAATDGE